MSEHIDVTPELADELWFATVEHMRQMCTTPIAECADDSGDDWRGIIDIMHFMFWTRWESDPVPALDAYLNTPIDRSGDTDTVAMPADVLFPVGQSVTSLAMHGCDGIPGAFYSLDCPALPCDCIDDDDDD